MSPLLSGGGYSSEGIAFALGLEPRLRTFGVRQFAEQHNDRFFDGLSPPVQANLSRLQHRGARAEADRGVAICHSTPDALVPSKFPGWDAIAPCPPPRARVRIGRTMFETDSIPADWVARCNGLDEVWVPTSFHVDTFAAAGVLRRTSTRPPRGVRPSRRSTLVPGDTRACSRVPASYLYGA